MKANSSMKSAGNPLFFLVHVVAIAGLIVAYVTQGPWVEPLFLGSFAMEMVGIIWIARLVARQQDTAAPQQAAMAMVPVETEPVLERVA